MKRKALRADAMASDRRRKQRVKNGKSGTFGRHTGSGADKFSLISPAHVKAQSWEFNYTICGVAGKLVVKETIARHLVYLL